MLLPPRLTPPARHLTPDDELLGTVSALGARREVPMVRRLGMFLMLLTTPACIGDAIGQAIGQCLGDVITVTTVDQTFAQLQCAWSRPGAFTQVSDGGVSPLTIISPNIDTRTYRYLIFAADPLQTGELPTFRSNTCQQANRMLVCVGTPDGESADTVNADIEVLQAGRLPGETVDLIVSNVRRLLPDGGSVPLQGSFVPDGGDGGGIVAPQRLTFVIEDTAAPRDGGAAGDSGTSG